MNIHFQQALGLLYFLLTTALASSQSFAANELGQGSFEYCDHALRVAQEKWPDAKELDLLADDEFERETGYKRTFLLGAAGEWNDIRRVVLDHGVESVYSTHILVDAASSGRTKIVEKLVELGMSPNGSDIKSVPLSGAAQCGRSETLRTLLRLGANPNFQGTTLQDAMFVAILQDDWEIGKILMEHDYDPCVLELKDGRNINDVLSHMRQKSTDYPAVWQQVECRRE